MPMGCQAFLLFPSEVAYRVRRLGFASILEQFSDMLLQTGVFGVLRIDCERPL